MKSKILVLLALLCISTTIVACATKAILPPDGKEFTLKYEGLEDKIYVHFMGDDGKEHKFDENEVSFYYDRSANECEYAIVQLTTSDQEDNVEFHLLKSKKPKD